MFPHTRLAPSCNRDCLLIWKSYCGTVFPVSSVWKNEKCRFFESLHFTIYRYTYWLSNLFKNFGLFYHPQMVKGLPWPWTGDCLSLWKSYCRTVFPVSSLWNSEKITFFDYSILPSVDTLIGLVIYLKISNYFTTHRW